MGSAEDKSGGHGSSPLGCSMMRDNLGSPVGLKLKIGYDVEEKDESLKKSSVGCNANIWIKISPKMKLAVIVLLAALVLIKCYSSWSPEAGRVIHDISKDLKTKSHGAAQAISHFGHDVADKFNTQGLKDLAVRLHLKHKQEPKTVCNFGILLTPYGYSSILAVLVITLVITIFGKLDRTRHIILVVVAAAIVSAGAFTYRAVSEGLPEIKHFNLGWIFLIGAIFGLAIASFRLKKFMPLGGGSSPA